MSTDEDLEARANGRSLTPLVLPALRIVCATWLAFAVVTPGAATTLHLSMAIGGNIVLTAVVLGVYLGAELAGILVALRSWGFTRSAAATSGPATGVTSGVAASSVAVYSVAVSSVPVSGVAPAAVVMHEVPAISGHDTADASQLAVMRRMACGVAHDFNNLLTVIRSAAQLQRFIARDTGVVFETLGDIEDATARGTALTAHLLTFGAPPQAAPMVLQPAILVRHALPLLRHVAGETVLVDMQADEGVAGATIDADPLNVERLLDSLVMQARDAMPFGGSISISCRAVTTREALTHQRGTLSPGRYVTVAVQDTGRTNAAAAAHHRNAICAATAPGGDADTCGGIDGAAVHAANAAVIITSSAMGGTCRTVFWPQLDLVASGDRPVPAELMSAAATVAARATPVGSSTGSHDGSIPRPAIGVTARPQPRVRLAERASEPSAGAPPQRQIGANAASPAAAGKTPRTILLVDDDESVCRVVSRQLQGSGFVVLTAGCAEDALTMLRDPASAVSAVVSDVRMPGMSGVELVSTMIAEGIQRPVVLVSGMMDEKLPESWPETAQVRFLAKPLSGVALRRTVNDLLASRDRARTIAATA